MRTWHLAALAVSTLPAPAIADDKPAGLGWWPADQRAAYVQYEQGLLAIPARDSLLAWHQLLGSEPHVAGSEGDQRTIERLERAFTDMGLEVERHTFWALLARPVTAVVEVVAPETISLVVKEEALSEDEFSAHPGQMIGWNAYSGSGDITAGVVYANYGRKEDFAKLADLGVDCTGKIVVCRYGGNFRGYKAKFAEEAGAAGVIIYTDPADSGYTKGIPYPEGGWANHTCIERGSIATLGYSGDPLTPGVEATENAQRLSLEDVALPTIPVQPVPWISAQEILKRMTGDGVPEGWQGGLPFAYRTTGGDDLKVHLKVEQTRAIMPSANVIATLKGAVEPERMVIIGCHHDAWGCGASDPLAGTIALLDVARAFAQEAEQGRPPARTIIFAAWGAEEFGIIGSSEWVEGNRARLVREAAAYINLDMASMGPNFGASTSPSLRGLVMDAAQAVPQARDAETTVFEAWLARGEDPLQPGCPKFGDIGGGSDHIAFLCHAGIPSTSLGGGGSKGTAYHTVYDTLPWYWKVVGEDYEPALMVSRMTAAVSARLADAPVLPLEPWRYGLETRRALENIRKRGSELGMQNLASEESGLAGVEEAAIAFEEAGRTAHERIRAAIEAGTLTPEETSAINTALVFLDRAWLDENGIPGRPWFKNLFSASDEDSGYAAWVLPGLRRAVEHKDAEALSEAAALYTRRLRAMQLLAEGILPEQP